MSNALEEADTRLAVYGTLAPGRANHHVLADINGRWITGSVRGRLIEFGWGAAHGFPAIILDDEAGAVPVHVLEADDLPAHWQRLDAFEGAEYQRVAVDVSLDNGEAVKAMIYAAGA